jgi:hypothetical protein
VVEVAQTAALDAARDTLPDGGKWSILLPFAAGDDGVWRAPARDLRGQVRRWIYDGTAGLREAPAARVKPDEGRQP